ncbi:MarR family winged helix-turn-helix transcriptional regulator [Paenibacillus pinistramenti]|uniref:MarR family winged helix-turn-helix transcriptional regulator n=1 Tax=Paenibacillus pinistramenti TaxID=1768003 RepID=UPI001107BADC|nr:MarR family transcriptional regulator [Paenibacillus pinistramenti]
MSKPINQALNECLFFTVKKLDRIMDKIAEEAFKPTGLSPTYGFILLAVNENPGITQKELSDLLHTAPSTIARFVDKLESKQLVRSEHSGRSALTYLTESGIEMVDQVNKAWDTLHSLYGQILGEQESDALSLHIGQIGDQLKLR